MKLRLVSLIAALGGLASCLTFAAEPGRIRMSLDFGWKFHLGDADVGDVRSKAGAAEGPAGFTFCDAAWRSVNLPHDWAIELPIVRNGDAMHAFRPIGRAFPESSIGWYRRTFTLPVEAKGRRFWLEFDGVFRDAIVFVNGYRIARNESGYTGFRIDITDYLLPGLENLIAVRVDASEFEGWFWEGAGIYRHVWLTETDPVAIAPDGVFVYGTFGNDRAEGTADVHCEADVRNDQDVPVDANITWQIKDPHGNIVARTERTISLDARSGATVKGLAQVAAPELWTPETPRLYTLITTIAAAGRALDNVETEFGLRTFKFDPQHGFLLNGAPYLVKGLANHQDHAGVGAALPDALQYWRAAKLKEIGCNAYRTAHNPPTPELIQACDRLGLLVMPENRLLGSSPENLSLLEQLVRRYRNNASVFLWNLANEERAQEYPEAEEITRTMQQLVQRLDPTRAVAAATFGNFITGINRVIQVRGFNYFIEQIDAYHAQHPEQACFFTEIGANQWTRGIYADDPSRGYFNAYDHNVDPRYLSEGWWPFVAERPWLSGAFQWTGFDYHGESPWPRICPQFGIMDLCGFPKDCYYYFQSAWLTKPVLHLMPHWNWTGQDGKPIDVRAFTNCSEVELFLDGRSLGRREVKRFGSARWQVPFHPGTLSAKGFDHGKLVVETSVATTGPAVAVKLVPDRRKLRGDGVDAMPVTLQLVDAAGHLVPTADNEVHFTLMGPGRLIGLGNGDPSSHEPEVFIDRPAIRRGSIHTWWFKSASADELASAFAKDVVDTRWGGRAHPGAEPGRLSAGESGVYRAHLDALAADFERGYPVTIRFPKIAGKASVYIDGKLAAKRDEPGELSFDARPYLHPGDNALLVAVVSDRDGGGMLSGAEVEISGEASTAIWHRHAFNGLAQVIVQANKSAGPLRLTASCDGFASTTIELGVEPAGGSQETDAAARLSVR